MPTQQIYANATQLQYQHDHDASDVDTSRSSLQAFYTHAGPRSPRLNQQQWYQLTTAARTAWYTLDDASKGIIITRPSITKNQQDQQQTGDHSHQQQRSNNTFQPRRSINVHESIGHVQDPSDIHDGNQ